MLKRVWATLIFCADDEREKISKHKTILNFFISNNKTNWLILTRRNLIAEQ
jgi:hypothetical protein